VGRPHFVEKFGVVDFDIMGIMKVLIIVLLACGTIFYLFFPPVNKERLCYEASQTSLEGINYDTLARGITASTQCERSADALYTLEACIQDATKSSAAATGANNVIQWMITVVRPYSQNIWQLKADHNETCAKFNRYQLP
jgi:uncharacterized membrane protein